jgi:tetratricopeptide (TPR) repeat protein
VANRSAAGNQTPATNPAVKREPKKARESYKRGLKAEQEGDWEAAHSAYSDAVNWSPNEHEYLLRREVAKSHLVQAKVDLAERDAVSGRLKDARKELLDASYLDPTNTTLRERLTELSALDTRGAQEPPAGD